MRTLKIENIQNFIVFSDIHLRSPKDEITTLFIDSLNSIITNKKNNLIKVDAVFFLGDIFDFISFSKNFFFNFWEKVFYKIYEMKNAGIATYFVEGNHDFGCEHFASQKLTSLFTNCGDCIIEFEHQKMGLIVLRHGDNLVCHPSYLTLRALFKSKVFQKIASFLCPGQMMAMICNKYAQKSRKHGMNYTKLTEDFLKMCLLNYLKEYENIRKKRINTLIIGHIHVFIHTYFQNTLFLVGPDWWTAPNYLYCRENGEAVRIFINTTKSPKKFLTI